jgi:hypothetical protein
VRREEEVSSTVTLQLLCLPLLLYCNYFLLPRALSNCIVCRSRGTPRSNYFLMLLLIFPLHAAAIQIKCASQPVRGIKKPQRNSKTHYYLFLNRDAMLMARIAEDEIAQLCIIWCVRQWGKMDFISKMTKAL